jgi:enoyl-CoA hydratase/carnithine racemase
MTALEPNASFVRACCSATAITSPRAWISVKWDRRWLSVDRTRFTADEFGAEEAMRIGLVQEVVPAGEQLERAAEVARQIAAQAPLGVQATLANARVARAAAEHAAAEHLRETVPRVLRSADAVEGLRSFLERRAGDFTGE